MNIIQKFVTVLFVVTQLFFVVCALYILSSGVMQATAGRGRIAIFAVVFYTLTSAGYKLAGLYATTRRTSDGKGVLDL